jgi:CBS domain-containing protein
VKIDVSILSSRHFKPIFTLYLRPLAPKKATPRGGGIHKKVINKEDSAMLRARDVMKYNVISVNKDTPILEAMKLLVDNNISGLPVIEDDMTLVGMLSEKDVVDLFYESDKAQSKTVDDYMTCPAVHFEENHALMNVCNFLVKNIFRRVPITTEGKLVGIISISDILRFILLLNQEKVLNAN